MLRRNLAVVAVVAGAWALAVWGAGGIQFPAGGMTVSSRDPLRPLAVALLAAAVWAALAGPARWRSGLSAAASRLSTPRLALLLALATTAFAVSQNAWTAGGSDAYAYVTQAELLRQGRLSVPVTLPASVPWPNALATLTPLGYGAAHGGAAIAPITPPGFPILMASLAIVGGHCAQFLVAPLCAGLLVWVTFAIGRRAGSPGVGLGAAWLLATSPTLLIMATSVMSDVPAAAFWAVAVAGALRVTEAGAHERETGARWIALAAGLAASMAILIRPNLVPLAAVVAGWLLWHAARAPRRTSALAIAFAAGATPGALGVAWFQQALWGSAFASGYGDLGLLFSVSHIPANLRQFGQWMVETQTPLAVAGLAALAIPLRVWWPASEARRAACLLALLTLAVWGVYLAYTPFDAWWFLRFLLPAWPALAIGMSVVTVRSLERAGAWGLRAAVAILILVGVVTASRTPGLGVFLPGEGERRYVTIAEQVARVAEPHSVIITGQHSGSIRHYAGRLTLRFEVLDEAWLDRTVAWLATQGRPAYLLLEDWELPRFEARFASRNALGRIALAPVLAYRAHLVPGQIYLFDPRRPDGPTERSQPLVDPRPRCAPPAPDPLLSGTPPLTRVMTGPAPAVHANRHVPALLTCVTSAGRKHTTQVPPARRTLG